MIVASAIVVGALIATFVTLAVTHLTTTSSPSTTSSPKRTHTTSPKPRATSSGSAPTAVALDCPTATRHVSTAKELQSALTSAKPGDVISLAPGKYSGNFEITSNGTSSSPIWLCGTSDAVLDGETIKKDYVLHINHASYWRLDGFTVQDGQKGVVADGSTGSIIAGLTVTGIGDEGIHLRDNSTNNTVEDNTISHTGLLRAKFGEGIYIGTAVKNWESITGSSSTPDRSDDNTISGNHISNTTAENVDIKEGTTGGKLIDNFFDGTGMVEAGGDSWVDVKGDDWTISGNHGVNSINDGFQTHRILNGWGDDNVFSDNTADVNGPGFAFHLTPALNNVVECNNVVSGAAQGTSNIKCSGG